MKRINFPPNCKKDCHKYMDFIFENYLKRNSKILIGALIGFIDWPKYEIHMFWKYFQNST